MPVSLVATLGSSSANSYVSAEDADEYFANLLSFDQWDALSDEAKGRALITATADLEAGHYKGDAVTTTQALKFPRYLPGVSDGTTMPKQIVAATCELALSLALKAAAGLTGESERMAMRAEGVLSWSMGNRSESLAPMGAGSSEAFLAGFPRSVQNLLQGWARGAFSTDSGRRPVYANGNCDEFGRWWPRELL